MAAFRPGREAVAALGEPGAEDQDTSRASGGHGGERTVTQPHERAPEDLKTLYDSLEQYLLSLGDDGHVAN